MRGVVMLGAGLVLVLVPPLRPDRSAPAVLRHGARVIAAPPPATISPRTFPGGASTGTRIRREATAPCGAWNPPPPVTAVDAPPWAARQPSRAGSP